MLIYIIVFIVFMVIKSMLFREILKIPEVDSWIIYLPLILAAFAWQAAVLLQRFVELVYRASYLLIAIAVCTLLNILLNLLLVPRYGMEASPAIMFLTSLLYLSFLFLMAFLGSKKIAEHQAVPA
jgi:O-antigen/teichoic acid export membrane protein